MPRYLPILDARQLPSVGESIERPVTDFKKAPATSTFECAKDVAAFANHLGGVLVVGATESEQVLRAYVGLSRREAGDALRRYSSAVADLCEPRPHIDPQLYIAPNDPDKRVIAVNVEPSLDLIAVRVQCDKTWGYGDKAYVYPVRSGTDARYLEPGQVAMFMTPQIRRVAVMLARIPRDAPIRVSNTRAGTSVFFTKLREEENLLEVREVRETRRVGTLNLMSPTKKTEHTRHVPLDMIRSVYQDHDDVWVVRVDPA